MMKQNLSTILLIGCLTLSFVAAARAANEIGFDEVLNSMRTARESLKSGVFHVSGTATEETGNLGPEPDRALQNRRERSNDIRVLCAFDFDKGLFRSGSRSHYNDASVRSRRLAKIAG
jgi:hypothetical protein